MTDASTTTLVPLQQRKAERRANLHSRDTTGEYPLTDVGNAERFAARWQGTVKYCFRLEAWLVWNGRRWEIDAGGLIGSSAKAVMRGIGVEAVKQNDDAKRQALLQWARQSENVRRIEGMISLARNEQGMSVEVADLDRDPWLLNVENGTLDLRTGELKPHDPGNLITKIAPLTFDADAECPVFDTFLERIFDADVATISFVQRAIGYSLTGRVSEQAMFIAYGKGANGKSTLFDAVRHVLGEYATHTPAETFLSKRSGGGAAASPDLARLRGARFVTAVEADQGRRLAEALVKEITGGDPITARHLHKEYFEFKPQCKVWLATNHKPDIRGTDDGIWRRIHLLPFSVAIPKEQQDKDLMEKLRAEAPGILAWAARGCLDWQQRGLMPPSTVTQATDEYRADSDELGDFIAAKCEIDPTAQTAASALYSAYKGWCEDNGSDALSSRRFGSMVAERAEVTKKRLNSGYVYVGVRLV
jgi:putative DNA primase/helicase